MQARTGLAQQPPATSTHTSLRPQSLALLHWFVPGQVNPNVSTHCLPPAALRKQWQKDWPRQLSWKPGLAGWQLVVLRLHGFLLLRASAGDEKKGSSAVPKSAPPVSLMALRREMVSEASSLDRSSKEGIFSKRGLRPSPLQFSSLPNNSGASFLSRGLPEALSDLYRCAP
jgi:hypothetical protein